MKQRVIIIFIIMIISFARSYGGITLTEVLANEPGSYTSLEWIELYNYGRFSEDISGWFVAENGDTEIIPAGSVIPGESFAVLSRRPVAEDPEQVSFEKQWGDGSGFWGDGPDENYPLFEVKMSLRNSEGKLVIFNGADSVSGFTWYSDAGDGVSFEKQDIDGPDLLSNWAVSSSMDGCTPGRAPGTNIIPPGGELFMEIVPDVVMLKSIESVSIRYTVPRGYRLTVEIYDINGRRVRTIYDEETNPPGEYIFDCRDDDGGLLKGGLYILYGIAEGPVTKKAKKIFVIAGQ
jgi:hypothetical protein